MARIAEPVHQEAAARNELVRWRRRRHGSDGGAALPAQAAAALGAADSCLGYNWTIGSRRAGWGALSASLGSRRGAAGQLSVLPM